MAEELKGLQDDRDAKNGEIAILRSKNESTLKEKDREIEALRKSKEDEIAQLKKTIETQRQEAANKAIENGFQEKERKDAEAKVRRYEAERKAGKHNGPVTTPKKKKIHTHRDGFDDDELQILSPSKASPSKFQKRPYSPSKPGKRKRKLDDSPAGKLDIHREDAPQVIVEVRDAPLSEALIAQLDITDDRYDVSTAIWVIFHVLTLPSFLGLCWITVLMQIM